MTKCSVFQLIDLDRTLFDTSKFVKAVTDEVDRLKPGLGTELDLRFEEAYEKEETFFLLRFLRQHYGNVWFEDLVSIVAEKYGAESFLISGARERLEFAETLSDEKPAWALLTYGDEIDQRMKMRLIGLEDAPVVFTPHPEKGEIMRSWQMPNGRFQLPEVLGGRTVDELVFEDDKLRAFHDLPEHVLGIWIAAPGKTNHAQGIELANSIVPVQNPFETIEILKNRYL